MARTWPQGRLAPEAPSKGELVQVAAPKGRHGEACQRQVYARHMEELVRTGALVGELGGGTRGRAHPYHRRQA